ncbi:hypothetical protein Trydic_g23275 [Trypoxylus dichotomus]
MNFHIFLLYLPLLIVVSAEDESQKLPELSEEDRQFLQDLPALQAGLLARLMYIFRGVAKREPAIRAALNELTEPEYYMARASLNKLSAFQEARKKLMEYDTLFKLTYFYDPLLFVLDLANPSKGVTPSFKPLFEDRKFLSVANNLWQLSEKANAIVSRLAPDDMVPNVSDVLSFIMSQEFANLVVKWSKLDLDLSKEFEMITKDYALKKLIERYGIKY